MAVEFDILERVSQVRLEHGCLTRLHVEAFDTRIAFVRVRPINVVAEYRDAVWRDELLRVCQDDFHTGAVEVDALDRVFAGIDPKQNVIVEIDRQGHRVE